MIELHTGRGWEYAYKKRLEDELEVYRRQLEDTGDSSHNYLRGVIRGIRWCIDEMRVQRLKHRQDGDADFDE